MVKFVKILVLAISSLFMVAFTVIEASVSLGKKPSTFWCKVAGILITPQENIFLISIILIIFVCLVIVYKLSIIVSSPNRNSGKESWIVKSALILLGFVHEWIEGRDILSDDKKETEEKIEDQGGLIASDSPILPYDEANRVEFDKAQLKTCLRDQDLLRNVDNSIVQTFVKTGVVKEYEKNSVLAKQGDEGNFVYFILQGSVNIVIGGKVVAVRGTHDCVGEMPAIDPTRKRMADIVALERVTVLEVPRINFSKFLMDDKAKNPFLFNLAKVFSNRIHEQSRFHKPCNEIPVVFVGSSSEAAAIADVLVNRLRSCGIKLTVVDWRNEDVFKPSITTIECLEQLAPKCDFAIMILDGDDRVFYRGQDLRSPRDNVVFELGLFMGVIGRARSFFLVDSAKVPSDLDGASHVCFKRKHRKPVLDEAVSKIVSAIKSEGTRCQ